jgi:hypothetical protein
MMDKIAFVINESDDGKFAAQAMNDADAALRSFTNLHGRAGDPPTRVTLITMDYKEKECIVRAKSLPVQESKDEQPDGVVLGKGPIWLDKEVENVVNS